jgi:ribosomal protein S19E (S16A)
LYNSKSRMVVPTVVVSGNTFERPVPVSFVRSINGGRQVSSVGQQDVDRIAITVFHQSEKKSKP